MVGGSSGGIEVAVLKVVLLGGTNGGAAWRPLPADVERTDGVSSKFWAN